MGVAILPSHVAGPRPHAAARVGGGAGGLPAPASGGWNARLGGPDRWGWRPRAVLENPGRSTPRPVNMGASPSKGPPPGRPRAPNPFQTLDTAAHRGTLANVLQQASLTPGRSLLQASDPAAQLEGPELGEWESTLVVVADLGFSEEDATTFLSQAFGWGGQGYWRKSKLQEIPSADEVLERMEFLEAIGIDDVAGIVSNFPEVLALNIDELRSNANTLEEKWFMKGNIRAKALMRRPEVLGYNIDCEGDCAGECNRCWVRF